MEESADCRGTVILVRSVDDQPDLPTRVKLTKDSTRRRTSIEDEFPSFLAMKEVAD